MTGQKLKGMYFILVLLVFHVQLLWDVVLETNNTVVKISDSTDTAYEEFAYGAEG